MGRAPQPRLRKPEAPSREGEYACLLAVMPSRLQNDLVAIVVAITYRGPVAVMVAMFVLAPVTVKIPVVVVTTEAR